MSAARDKWLFIKCQCAGEGMGVDYDAEDGYYYFSYWSMGLSHKSLPWKERLRYCWNVLWKGEAFNDEIMLNQKSANELIDFLLESSPIPDEKMEELLAAVRENFKEKAGG